MVDAYEFEHKCCASIMKVSAIVWSRLENPMANFPWLLLRLVDPVATEDEKTRVREAFLAKPMCELDPGFALPLRKAGCTFHELDNAAIELLDAVSKHAGSTNMGLERLLSLIKASTPPTSNRAPGAERLLYSGTLTQFLHRHLRDGGCDCRGSPTREQLIEAGVPIQAAANAGINGINRCGI